jgi:hypothetical protein
VPSDATNQATQQEWRELGFFYDRDDTAKEWRIVGSVHGLVTFARLIQDYAANPNNDAPSEHDHYGPYMYLEIGTWNEPTISDHWIAGRPSDLRRLSLLIRERLACATVGDRFTFRAVYAPSSPYDLVLDVRDDTFDPARADAHCW